MPIWQSRLVMQKTLPSSGTLLEFIVPILARDTRRFPQVGAMLSYISILSSLYAQAQEARQGLQCRGFLDRLLATVDPGRSSPQAHVLPPSSVDRNWPNFKDCMGSPSNTPSQIGKYEVTGVVGRGGMGTVYKATDARIGRPV